MSTLGTFPVSSNRKPKANEDEKATVRRTTVKVNVEIHRMARIIASVRGIDLADYLDAALLDIVRKDYAQARKQLNSEGDR